MTMKYARVISTTYVRGVSHSTTCGCEGSSGNHDYPLRVRFDAMRGASCIATRSVGEMTRSISTVTTTLGGSNARRSLYRYYHRVLRADVGICPRLRASRRDKTGWDLRPQGVRRLVPLACATGANYVSAMRYRS